MPRYLNGSSLDVSIEGCRVGVGKIFITTSNLLAHQIPTGVTKLSDAPYWSPVIVSEVKSGSSGETSVSIPETWGINTETGLPAHLTDYYLRLRCTAGSVSIKFNDASDADFGAPLILAAGQSDDDARWYIQDRDVFKVNIKFLESSSKVKVDVWNSK